MHLRRLLRRRGPVPVAFVPLEDVGQHSGLIRRLTPAKSLQRPPAGADMGSATTKIFTSASGQITVPISRPSSTAPGGSAAN
jgi:hypothetical protein